ncbi:DUF551 domain-containing protein [Eisenbergiella tayi]|uniref:DUF551 domain-containing protein n=1 Tax=Eisenbergiella tayi TaxID=1432052 RepID=UPI002A82BFDA|nr:DUF551 domain-containing protein [Eisenbergiella tayi]
MKRLTVDKSAREMTGTELAHNCMYAHDRWARYRDFEKDMDLFDFIRVFANAEKTELPADNEEAADMLLDGLQYSIDNPFGRVALVYNLMWAMADLRERLKAYEDTGLTPEEIMDGRMLTGWIPVSERLPEEPRNPIDEEEGAYDLPNLTEYNVTIADAQEATTLYYAGDDVWIDNCGNYYHVIAWMPLPEPYKPTVMQETGERAGEYADAPTLRPAT